MHAGSQFGGSRRETWEGVFEVKARTTKAVLVVDIGSGEEVWLPWSMIDEVHAVPERPGCSRIVMARWLAEKKGFLT